MTVKELREQLKVYNENAEVEIITKYYEAPRVSYCVEYCRIHHITIVPIGVGIDVVGLVTPQSHFQS